mmetsp:Transcript_8171/g.21684  ORF Transcript_8171/g.21684 Transcript_8171/m.21684 type:complete len:256 (-) Transcript_8171:1692-2459(-)
MELSFRHKLFRERFRRRKVDTRSVPSAEIRFPSRLRLTMSLVSEMASRRTETPSFLSWCPLRSSSLNMQEERKSLMLTRTVSTLVCLSWKWSFPSSSPVSASEGREGMGGKGGDMQKKRNGKVPLVVPVSLCFVLLFFSFSSLDTSQRKNPLKQMRKKVNSRTGGARVLFCSKLGDPRTHIQWFEGSGGEEKEKDIKKYKNIIYMFLFIRHKNKRDCQTWEERQEKNGLLLLETKKKGKKETLHAGEMGHFPKRI